MANLPLWLSMISPRILNHVRPSSPYIRSSTTRDTMERVSDAKRETSRRARAGHYRKRFFPLTIDISLWRANAQRRILKCALATPARRLPRSRRRRAQIRELEDALVAMARQNNPEWYEDAVKACYAKARAFFPFARATVTGLAQLRESESQREEQVRATQCWSGYGP